MQKYLLIGLALLGVVIIIKKSGPTVTAAGVTTTPASLPPMPAPQPASLQGAAVDAGVSVIGAIGESLSSFFLSTSEEG